MKYEVNFGSLSAAAGTPSIDDCFRIAVLADLSGRANQGKLETGDALAARKPLRVDVDNLDDLVERLDIQLHLPISDDGGSVQVPLTEMDAFHPDELYDGLEVFSKFLGLPAKLADPTTFGGAAKAIQRLLGSLTVLSSLAVASVLSSGENSIERTIEVCPSNSRTTSSELMSQSRTILSDPAEANCEPSAENAIARTAARCPVSVEIGWPEAASHNRTVRSYPPEANRFPSGENLTT